MDSKENLPPPTFSVRFRAVVLSKYRYRIAEYDALWRKKILPDGYWFNGKVGYNLLGKPPVTPICEGNEPIRSQFDRIRRMKKL
jgi:hypothetical protein